RDASDFAQALRVPEAQLGGAVAHDDALAILSEAPPFAWVLELTLRLETGEVVNETDVRLPGQLQQPVLPVDNAFTKILFGEVPLLEHFAGFQLYLADR